MKLAAQAGVIFVIVAGTFIAYRFAASSEPHAAPNARFATRDTALAIPLIAPGDTCDKIRTAYGNERSLHWATPTSGTISWELDDLHIFAEVAKPCTISSIIFTVNPGRTATTPDGVILGGDTMQSATQKLPPALKQTSWGGDGQKHVELEIPQPVGSSSSTSYGWVLKDATATKIGRREAMLSDFTDEKVKSYDVSSHEEEKK
jgi:hypothetical protein